MKPAGVQVFQQGPGSATPAFPPAQVLFGDPPAMGTNSAFHAWFVALLQLAYAGRHLPDAEMGSRNTIRLCSV